MAKHYNSNLKSSVVVKKSNKQPFRKLSNRYNFNSSKSIKSNNKPVYTNLGVVGGAFKVIVSIILIVVVMRFFLVPNSPIITFNSLLEILQGTPEFIPFNSIVSLEITADWGIFNFFKDFLNLFTGAFEFLLGILDLLQHSVKFIGYYLQVLFRISI